MILFTQNDILDVTTKLNQSLKNILESVNPDSLPITFELKLKKSQLYRVCPLPTETLLIVSVGDITWELPTNKIKVKSIRMGLNLYY